MFWTIWQTTSGFSFLEAQLQTHSVFSIYSPSPMDLLYSVMHLSVAILFSLIFCYHSTVMEDWSKANISFIPPFHNQYTTAFCSNCSTFSSHLFLTEAGKIFLFSCWVPATLTLLAPSSTHKDEELPLSIHNVWPFFTTDSERSTMSFWTSELVWYINTWCDFSTSTTIYMGWPKSYRTPYHTHLHVRHVLSYTVKLEGDVWQHCQSQVLAGHS